MIDTGNNLHVDCHFVQCGIVCILCKSCVYAYCYNLHVIICIKCKYISLRDPIYLPRNEDDIKNEGDLKNEYDLKN